MGMGLAYVKDKEYELSDRFVVEHLKSGVIGLVYAEGVSINSKRRVYAVNISKRRRDGGTTRCRQWRVDRVKLRPDLTKDDIPQYASPTRGTGIERVKNKAKLRTCRLCKKPISPKDGGHLHHMKCFRQLEREVNSYTWIMKDEWR